MFELKDKIALVTGASSGLGADAARAYAKSGAHVALLARRKEKLDSIADEIKSMGGTVFTAQCDITKEESVKSAVESVIGRYGRIDILLNNAGVAVRGGVDSLSEADWDRAMDTNVKGIFLMSKYVIPYMQKQNYGKIINTSSVNAFIADKSDLFIRHSYNASKSAVIGLTRGMAASYGKYGITVNAVCPGLFETGMTENTLFKSQEFLDSYSFQCPMGRPGQKGEVNGPVLFFSSDASSYVTGQHIIIDGGTSLV